MNFNGNSCGQCGPLVVTDILIRGGGGTITFSDNVTIEYIFKFRPDASVPAGGVFDITLQGPRATLVYQTVVSQAVCDMVDWILQCSSLNHRVAILELEVARLSGSSGSCCAAEFSFTVGDWSAGSPNQVKIVDTGVLSPGVIGAHHLGNNRVFHVSVFRDDGTPVFPKVDIEILVNIPSGAITIRKTGLGAPFAGRVIVSSGSFV